MLSIISKYPDEFRTVRFNATPEDEPEDAEFVYVSLMPIEVQRLMEYTLEEVQVLLRRYI